MRRARDRILFDPSLVLCVTPHVKGDTVETLRSIFGTTDNVLMLALSDLTDETARRRSRGQEGPSVAWTVGHLLDHRFKVLRLLRVDRESPYAAKFGDTAATDGADYPTLADFRQQWADVLAELEEAFANAAADLLERSLSDAGAHGETRLRDKLAFYAWHEGYHMGAIGAARKAFGLPGPAELVVAASRTG